MLTRFSRLFRLVLTGTLSITLLSACSVQQHLMRNAADALSIESRNSDDDLELLMHASAYHLKLSESLLSQIPDHVKLAQSVTRGYTQYAFVYLMDEADRSESDDIQKATQLRSRAAKMLFRAKSLGMKTLRIKHPQIDSYLQGRSTFNLTSLSPDDVGLVYWSMTSWACAISLSKDSPDIVADFPEVLRLAHLAWQVNPQFEQGALASMMGTLELSKPDVKLQLAENYFDLAIQWRKDQIAPLVSKAENWAVATRNRDAYVQLLEQAIDLGRQQNDLTNSVMLRRASWLLENVENYF